MDGKRLLLFPLALLLALMLASATGAAESGYNVAIVKVQKLTAGAAFDEETAEEIEGRVSAGDVVVLTIGFRNNSGDKVNLNGFQVNLRYDKAQVAPYAAFDECAYQVSETLTGGKYKWTSAGNESADGLVNAAAIGVKSYAVDSGAEAVLVRMAFRADANLDDALTPFRFDATRIIDSNRQNILDADKAITLTLRDTSGNAVSAEDLRNGAEVKPELAVPESANETIAEVFLAVYDSQDRMIGLKRWELDASQPAASVPAYAMPENQDIAYAKLMILSESLAPLAAAQELR